ncbi:MAG: CoA transferase subunit A [Anaerolineae bacterium]|nr:CoA transferase subunit A [Anaerolineae bacterium]
MSKTNKVISLQEAVKEFIHDGTHITFGGFTMQRHPMAFIREMIRQRKRDLVIYGHSPGIDADILIGAGAVKRVEVAYIGDELFVSPSPNFRKAIEEGSIQWEDYSNFGATLRLVAGALGLPFIPARTMLGSDMITKSGFEPEERCSDPKAADKKLVLMDCPFTGDKVVLLPAVNPDVAVIHAQMVGCEGTVRILGQSYADDFMTRAARKVVVTTEEIVSEEFIRRCPEQNCVPFFRVDAIVHVPYGTHPTACHGYYDYDPDHYAVYAQAAKAGAEAFQAYLEKYVYGVKDHWDYLDRVGGAKRLSDLKADSALGYNPNVRRR